MVNACGVDLRAGDGGTAWQVDRLDRGSCSEVRAQH